MADTKISELDTTNRNALRSEALTPRGALIGLSADLTAVNASSGYTVPFNAESYDTDSVHDNVTNNSRLVVPTGISWVRVGFSVFLTNVTVGNGCIARMRHYNSSDVEQSRRGLPVHEGDQASYTEWAASGLSGPISVAEGDYFNLLVQSNDASLTVFASLTSAWMELLA